MSIILDNKGLKLVNIFLALLPLFFKEGKSGQSFIMIKLTDHKYIV